MHPGLDIEKARFNMVEQQVRTWDVLDQSVLDLLFIVKREEFVPPAYRALAFADMEIPLRIGDWDSGEFMWAPKMEARILQELAIRSNERVLEIGTGSGHMAALLAHKADDVVSLEIEPRLKAFAESNLRRAGVHNVRVELADGSRWPVANAPYDVIVVTGSLPIVTPALTSQLKVGGRLAAIVGEEPAMVARIITRATEDGYDVVNLFETHVKPLRNAPRLSSFKF
ncbi:MAG TPA: protein-L-isoaspartate O-methyltransferase [Burkholderiaceae bacterium]|nr:protein-L-isoaspartate O-methyltransferase [Burkholderiaceae bacterium]